MFAHIHKKKALRFRYWSRKAYAAFLSIGKHVTIGNLKHVVADSFLGKQKNTMALTAAFVTESYEGEPEEGSDPPDAWILLLLNALLPVPARTICKQEGINLLYEYFYYMADSNSAIGHFYFNSKQKL